MEKWETLKMLQEGKVIECKSKCNSGGILIKLDESNKLLFSAIKTEKEWLIGNWSMDIFMTPHYDFVEYVEEEFKVGDWVVSKGKTVFQIKRLAEDIDGKFSVSKSHYAYLLSELRKATKDEVANELERSKWAKWNRKVNEWKVGDIIRESVNGKFVEVGDEVQMHNGKIEGVYSTCVGYYRIDEITMICTVESRLDKIN